MASDDFAVTKVEYRLTGGNLMGVIVASGVRTVYGWLARWDTTKVANGTYALQSVAFDAAGNSGHSAGVVVTVGN